MRSLIVFSHKERTNEELVTLAVRALVGREEEIQGFYIDDILDEASIYLEGSDQHDEEDFIEAVTFAEANGFIDLVEWDQANQLAEYKEAVIDQAENNKAFGEGS